MCMDPVSMMIAGSVISSAGTLYGGISSYSQANSNAKLMEQQADLRLAKGEADAADAQRRYDRVHGTAVATAAASGIDLQSFADVFADDAAEASLERKRIRAGAQADSNNVRAQAAGMRTAGKNALVGSVFAAAGSAFSNAAKANSIKYPTPQGDY